MAATAEEATRLLTQCRSQSKQLVGTVSALLGVCTITTGLRLYARWRSGRSAFGWDDAFACLALLSLIPEAVLLIINSKASLEVCDILILNEGSGILSDPNVVENLTIYAASITYQIACMLPKMSICFLYFRVFRDKITRRITQGMIIFLMASCAAFTASFVLFCIPPDTYWLTNGKAGKCLNAYTLEVSRSIPHIVTDIIMLILPLPTVRKLQVSQKRRLAIAATFATGCLGLAGCCIRLAYYAKHYTEATEEEEYKGIAWEIYYQLRLVVLDHIFTMVEPASYLIAANLPPLRALTTRFRSELGVTTWLRYRFPTRHSIATWVRRTLHTPRREQFPNMQDDAPISDTHSPPQIKRVTHPTAAHFENDNSDEVRPVASLQ